MNTFSELSLCEVLQRNLTDLGFVKPTPIQAGAIPVALNGRDIVATAQTGTGKTLAFLLPLLESFSAKPRQAGVAALILSPTRELAIQIHEVFVELSAGSGVRSALVAGGLSEQAQLRAIRGGAQVLIATPGRLTDFLDRRLVSLSGVRTLVLDEADRMLDMGFLPALKRLLAAMPKSRQTLFFSATIESSVAHLVNSYLKDPVRIAIGPVTKPVERIDLRVYEIQPERKLSLLENMLRRENGSFLVFARTKRGADRLAKKLSQTGVRAAAIHGDRTQNQRTSALRGFQQGNYRVLVATDVASRGIHVEGIAHVVNFDLPQVPEDFIHRVGRTGRAGVSGVATTFVAPSDLSEMGKIEKVLGSRIARHPLPAGLESERKHAAPVIVMPAGNARNPRAAKPIPFTFVRRKKRAQSGR